MVVVCGLLGGWLLLGVIGRIRRLPFKPMRHASSGRGACVGEVRRGSRGGNGGGVVAGEVLEGGLARFSKDLAVRIELAVR